MFDREEINRKISETKKLNYKLGLIRSYERDLNHRRLMSEIKKKQWMEGKIRKRKTKPSKFGFSYEDLARMYWIEGKTMNDIAFKYGTNAPNILWWMRKWGIQRRPRSTSRFKEGGRRYARCFALLNKKKECEVCKLNEENKLIVHHKDNNYKNNDLTNLQILCEKCHAKIHNRIKNFNKGIISKIEKSSFNKKEELLTILRDWFVFNNEL